MLVGAPRAPTRQPGVTRGGAVYRCPLDNRLNCQQIPFDTKGNEIRHNGTHYRDVEDKSDQWFGASLYSSSNGTIVAIQVTNPNLMIGQQGERCVTRRRGVVCYKGKECYKEGGVLQGGRVLQVGEVLNGEVCYKGEECYKGEGCYKEGGMLHRVGLLHRGEVFQGGRNVIRREGCYTEKVCYKGERCYRGGGCYKEGGLLQGGKVLQGGGMLKEGRMLQGGRVVTSGCYKGKRCNKEEECYKGRAQRPRVLWNPVVCLLCFEQDSCISSLFGTDKVEAGEIINYLLHIKASESIHMRERVDKSLLGMEKQKYSVCACECMACAPRYVYFSSRLDKREPVGTCYVARPSSTDYEEYSPCKSNYAVGVPRGRQLQGKVVLYRQNLTIIDIIRGEQFGSYFGYSLAVTDIDKDGLDDVIRSFTKRNKDVLDGHDSQSRFGLSVAAIGDIDYDNYNDIAVGAPYGGKNGRGVVYIYHGSMKGIITDVQQALHADDVIQEGAETFGWSLAGGMDMDENKYPDLMIGAYNSNRAALVRSRPVVRVTPTISVDPENITLSSENEICVINNGATKVHITVNVCILFNGVGVPDQMDFQMNITFDSLKNDSSRMYFLHSETTREESKVERAYKGVPKCERFFGYLVKNIRDKLTPIVTDFSFDIVDKAVRRSPREANIMKNCGQDNVCIPDLTITAMHTHDSYTLGEEKELDILVFVTNKGEDAFESILNITVPEGVEFRKIKDKKYEIPIFCNVFNKSFISCDLGNPLPAKSRTNFTLVALPKNITGNEPEMVFRIAVNSSNAENISDYRNNVAEIKIPLQQAANLRIGGKPVPEQFVYTESDVRQYRQKGVQGPLNNRGPTGVKTAMLTIDWPGQDENGLNFLYMDQTPIVSRPDISCILLNKTYTKYSEGPDSDTVIIDQRDTGDTSQVKRHKREATGQSTGDDTPDKRDVQTRAARELKTIKCEEGKLGCVHVQCTIGEIKPYQSVNITIRAKIWTSTIKKLQQPFYFVSKAKAEVLAMPFKMKIASSTLSLSVNEISTYVNPERLHPQRKGIEPWIIGVSIAAGLLVLLLLIVLLWWCGFFRRRRPEERAFLTSAAQNGDFSPVNDRVPDSKYKYT
ncbi:ITA8-like protein [Mya arenaria]|uniref:ITA8-like protein n=1 Tax=Mya arenaria TaxID=6604 RepID=A0ABY7EWC1_MYAAR|nr:ITA8-like protein [Mya arenaria]